jgi:hypothetical protein
LPNWGPARDPVETPRTRSIGCAPRRTQGTPWAYGIVLADLAGMRNTALALHRNLERHAIYGDVRLVCLHGDDAGAGRAAAQRRPCSSRLAPDADLRAALTAKPTVEAASASRQLPATTATAQVALRNARVLLVEDNPST